MGRRIAPMGRRSRAAACLGLAVALAPALAMAQAEPDCGRIGPLAGSSLSTLIFDLPAASETSEIWAMLGYDFAPIALPVRRVGPAQGALILPLTLHHDTPETVETTLVALDPEGALVWACADLVLDLTPPPPDPGGTERMAVRAEALAAQFEAALGADPAAELAGLAEVPTGLRVLAADLRSLPGEIGPEDLARADATFGAVARALAAGDPPAPPPGPPWRRNQAVKFFPAQIVETGPGTLADACPADPRQLTEYIDLGVRARINASADQQFLLTMSLTLFGASARLANAGLGGGRGVDRAIDLGATTLSTAQAVMTDYLAGMMPLNLDRLEITHDPTLIPDDTPRENRLFRIHSAVLHTRSDGWSPDKAALDVLLGLVSARTGGASGMASGSVSGGLRRYADDLVANVGPLAQHSAMDIRLAFNRAEIARRNLAVIERNAAALATWRSADLLPMPGFLGSSPRHIDAARQAYVQADIAAGTLLREADEAAQAAQTAARLRGGADLLDMVGAPVLGNAEGQAVGQLTGAIGAADMGPIGRIVSRCTVEMLRNGDGSRSRHLVFDVVEGDGEVLQVGLGDRIGFEVVGAGIRTARVGLNPALEYLPLTRQDVLPEARVTVHVDQIQGRIDGLPPGVAPWSIHSLSAWIGGVTLDPPLVWSVDPPLPLVVTGGQGVYTADLTVPEDLPEGTLITVSIRAEGDFISAAQVEPIWFAVAQVRSDDEEEEDAALTCAIHDGNRLRRLSPELNIAQRYASDATSFTEVWSNFCPRGSHARDFVSSLLPDALRAEQSAAGVVAWGGLPVHRIAGLHRVEAMLEARNTCMPETARGTVRDWLAAEAGQVETYLLGGCDMILLLGPQRGLLLEQQPIPSWPYWAIQYLHRQ